MESSWASGALVPPKNEVSWLSNYAPPGHQLVCDFADVPHEEPDRDDEYRYDVYWLRYDPESKRGSVEHPVTNMHDLYFGDLNSRGVLRAVIAEAIRVPHVPIPDMIVDYLLIVGVHCKREIKSVLEHFMGHPLTHSLFFPSCAQEEKKSKWIDGKPEVLCVSNTTGKPEANSAAPEIKEQFTSSNLPNLVESIWYWAAPKPRVHAIHEWVCVFSVRCPKLEWSEWFPKFACLTAGTHRLQAWPLPRKIQRTTIRVAWSMSDLINYGIDDTTRKALKSIIPHSQFASLTHLCV